LLFARSDFVKRRRAGTKIKVWYREALRADDVRYHVDGQHGASAQLNHSQGVRTESSMPSPIGTRTDTYPFAGART
jgi:hypothetical protein